MKDSEIALIEKFRSVQKELRELSYKKDDALKQQADIKDLINNIDEAIIQKKDLSDRIVLELKELLMENK